MKTKKKARAPAAGGFTRGERIGTKSGHARRGAAGRRAEHAANEGQDVRTPDPRVPPA